MLTYPENVRSPGWAGGCWQHREHGADPRCVRVLVRLRSPEHAAKLNWEGIISKLADAPCRSERTEAWLKIKTVQKGKFPVIGFVKDPTGVAALYLGKKEGKDLVYMGKVGTGWDEALQARFGNSSIPS